MPPLTLTAKQPGEIPAPGREVRLALGRQRQPRSVVQPDAYKERIWIGAYVDQGATFVLAGRDLTQGQPEVDANDTPTTGGGYTRVNANQTGGAKIIARLLTRMGMDCAILINFSPKFHELNTSSPGSSMHIPAAYATESGGRLWLGVGPWSTLGGALDGQSIKTTFFEASGAPQDLTTATTFATEALVNSTLAQNTNIAFWLVRDDVTAAAKGAAVATMCQAFASVDPRPVSGVHRDSGSGSSVNMLTNPTVVDTYEYACGRYSTGADTDIGDFKRSTFGGLDYIEFMENRVAAWRAYDPDIWPAVEIQTHWTDYNVANDGTHTSQLRQPDPLELRKAFYQILAAGYKVVAWFVATGQSQGTGATWTGFLDYRNAAYQSVIAELNGRFSDDTRRRLATTLQVSSRFTVSGGGYTRSAPGTTYANGWTRTHYDATTSTYYCFAGNEHPTATQSLTITSGTLSGRLRDLATGTVYRLGEAIPFGPLDAKLFVLDELVGVPPMPIDWGEDVEARWARHWANPASSSYRPSSATRLFANVVNVPIGGDLQAYVDAAPDGTTFMLPDGGTYARVVMYGRNRLAFASVNPAAGHRGVVRGFDYYGTQHAYYYNSTGTVASTAGFPRKLFASGSLGADASFTTGFPSVRDQALGAFLNPPGNLIFKDLDFVSDGSPVYYQKRWHAGVVGGTWDTDHWYANAALGMRCVKDVLVEGCTASGYLWATDNSTTSPNDPQANVTGPTGHPGAFWGNSGIENVVIRDTTITFSPTGNAGGFGFPWGIFFDGPRGLTIQNVTITGKVQSGAVMCLTNDDYTARLRGEGLAANDLRNGWYMIVANSNFTGVTSGGALVSFTGARCLGKTNTFPGGRAMIYAVTTKICRLSDPPDGAFYRSYGCVVDGNTVASGNVTVFVGHITKDGFLASGEPSATSPYRSRVGYTTVKNNSVAGTIGSWGRDVVSNTDPTLYTAVPSDGGFIYDGSNNKTDGDSNR